MHFDFFFSFIVMHFFPDGSILDSMVKNNVTYTFQQKVIMCKQLASGLLHLYFENVVHGDISLR